MGMLNWKVIITVFIVLGFLLVMLTTNPDVSSFFESMKDKFFGMFGYVAEDDVPRNLSFYINVSSYDGIAVNTGRPVNISLDGEFLADIKNGHVESSTVKITNFKGYCKIEYHKLDLDGRFEKMEIANDSVSFEASTIKSNATFTKLTISNLVLADLDMDSATGSLFIRGAETKLSGQSVKIKNPLGTFEFNNGLKAIGFASRISIPSLDMTIG